MFILVMAASVSTATAERLHVETNGNDTSTCGDRRSPCRSISRAIENASAGDVILVGPGRYGDANADGDFNDSGDEPAEVGFGCYCVVKIGKTVTVVSDLGAHMTVIDAPLVNVEQIVQITASDATFGLSGQGFYINPSPAGFAGVPTGIQVVAGSGVTVGGNHVTGARSRGIRAEGTQHRIVNNVVMGSSAGLSITGTGSVIIGNGAEGNSSVGAELGGSGHVVEDNAFTGNLGIGLQIGSDDSLVQGNAIVGNHAEGIRILGLAAMITKNNIYGNLCGVQNVSNSTAAAPNNFWGSELGPGPDPADQICDLVGSVTFFDPPAQKPFRIQLR
jgi:hypothetical protein